MDTLDRRGTKPVLPSARGDLSDFVITTLRSDPARSAGITSPDFAISHTASDPLTSDDLHLALYTCYELHYMSFLDVSPDWEWNADLIRVASSMESQFLSGLADSVPCHDDIYQIINAQLNQDPANQGASDYLAKHGTVDQFRELLIHRSAYHLKEADPHTWVIPRLNGRPKAALCAVQLDEYGGGRPGYIHSELFAKTMRSLSLDSTYGAYLNQIPGFTLATVNLLTLFGLHRKWRAAIMGSLAVAEIKSSPSSARLAAGLRRLGFGNDAQHFFTEHIEADAVHEQLMRREVVPHLLELEPELGTSMAFGAQAFLLLGQISSRLMLCSWHKGESSLFPNSEQGEPTPCS